MAGTSAAPLQVRIKVDHDRASREFKEARRDLGGKMREALRVAGERAALPAARAAAWSPFAGTLVVRSTRSSAYITTRLRGKKGRAVGLLEWGGTVRTKIVPKSKLALTVGPDVVRANVTTPRHYRASLRLTKAVQARRAEIDETVLREVMTAFDGFQHTP